MITMTSSRHVRATVIAPTAGAFQGIALPFSGQARRPRPATFGTDLGHRTP